MGRLPFTFEFDPAAMEHVVEEGLRQLGDWGFEKIVVCDGSGSASLREMLEEKCQRATAAGEAATTVELTCASSGDAGSADAVGSSARDVKEGGPADAAGFARFEESRPESLGELIARSPVAYVPLGALEWHGEHGPLGLDGLKAHHICERSAGRTGGVVFPPLFWGAFDTMPFPFTFHFDRKRLEILLPQILAQLSEWGFEVIVLLTGHYPPTQVAMLRKQCRRFNAQGRALSIGVPEMAFATDIDYFGDHAGMWETSIMLAIQPDQVDLSAMPGGLPVIERLTRYGTMGKDPATRADAAKGRAAIDHIAAGLSNAVHRVRTERSDAAFEAAYGTYASALRILSPRLLHLVREALDVRSLGELVRYLRWTYKHQGRLG
jgi:creatinine amidohydrolase